MAELLTYLNYDLINIILSNCGVEFIGILPELQICFDILEKNPTLLKQIIEENKNHINSTFHYENWITHSYCVGHIMKVYADLFDIDEEYAFITGFLHDIGKSWAKKTIVKKNKNIYNYKGHAQIGEILCSTCYNLDDTQAWVISNHMCSCCHEGDLDKHFDNISSLQYLSFDNNDNIKEYFNLLTLLSFGDQMGRLGDKYISYTNVLNHSLNWKSKFDKNNTLEQNILKSIDIIKKNKTEPNIIIHMIGQSGYGKSTMVKELIYILNSLEIPCEYIERDDCFYEIYSKINKLEINEVKKIPYENVYKFITDNNLKKNIQELWIDKLNSLLLSNTFVKIIDTVQYMYPKAWNDTLNQLQENASTIYKLTLKLGCYGFPQHLLGRDYKPKTGSFITLPININDNMFFPELISELNENNNLKNNFNILDIGYGRIKPIVNTIKNYYKKETNLVVEKQVHIIEIVKNLIYNNKNITSEQICKNVSKLFPDGVLITSIELSSIQYDLLRFSYRDGSQVYNYITRDYRGEVLMFDKINKEIYIGRISLPVFVDYVNIQKDLLATDLINVNDEFVILPKYDGSLFVVSFIKLNSKEFNILMKLIDQVDSSSYVINNYGLWCFGSKSCMFAKNQNGNGGILSRIYESILGSYTNVEEFLEKIYLSLKNKNLLYYKNISILFEAIVKNPTEELTVDYDKSFCPLLSYIVYDNDKKIIYPENELFLKPYASKVRFNSWLDIMDYLKESHSKLLDGDMHEEPEGFVVWTVDKKSNYQIGIKLKHKEYYVAHKPDSHKNDAIEIMNDEKYKNLRERLIKFKFRPKIDDIIKLEINKIYDILFDTRFYCVTRKDWALNWQSPLKINQIFELFKDIESNLIIHYSFYKDKFTEKNIFSIIMNSFLELDNHDIFKKYFLVCLSSFKK